MPRRWFLCLVAGLSALVAGSTPVLADPAADCAAGAGQYVVGTLLSAPKFASGHRQNGTELSHSLATLKSDGDGKTYQVAMDNVFASGYDQANAARRVPAPLDSLERGDRVELCGRLFSNPLGIHWVHTNCGERPTASAPDGWIRKLDNTGAAGNNLENSTEYCGLWPR
jgi:hypothetical protein